MSVAMETEKPQLKDWDTFHMLTNGGGSVTKSHQSSSLLLHLGLATKVLCIVCGLLHPVYYIIT